MDAWGALVRNAPAKRAGAPFAFLTRTDHQRHKLASVTRERFLPPPGCFWPWRRAVRRGGGCLMADDDKRRAARQSLNVYHQSLPPSNASRTWPHSPGQLLTLVV